MNLKHLPSENSDIFVIQKRIYRRGRKCTWKTISEPITYRQALEQLLKMPPETTRLLTEAPDLMVFGATCKEHN
mgnify:FL=1